MSQNNNFNESIRAGDVKRPEDGNQQAESNFDPLALLREGQSGEQRDNLREATGQAVDQGMLPQIEITDDGEVAIGAIPQIEPQSEPAEVSPSQQDDTVKAMRQPWDLENAEGREGLPKD